MWPFRKKDRESSCLDEGLKKLAAFREVGETFNYLGRTCVVTRHWDYITDLGVIPVLMFDYTDKHGVLHSRTATLGELPGIIAQQKRKNGNVPKKKPCKK